MSLKMKMSSSIPVDGIRRVVIKNILPSVAGGKYPAKATEGVPVKFNANIIADGHDKLLAQVLVKIPGAKTWQPLQMKLVANDLWTAVYLPERSGIVEFRVQAWVSELESWKDAYDKKQGAGVDTRLDAFRGVELLEQMLLLAPKADHKELKALLQQSRENGLDPAMINKDLSDKLSFWVPKERVTVSQIFTIDVERKKASFSTWYELFPRSCSPEKGTHGTLADVVAQIPRLASAGFDVLYLPPIHPIGKLKRKGKNNSLEASLMDPGSPWAIGSYEGGHKSIHPELGTFDDFKKLVKEARKYGIEIAMDIAFQCAPDHPYVSEHPEWFKWRADGSVQYAENPPKKYEDILPFDFESSAWPSLWEELLSIFLFWIGKGVNIFRVDNPHTKSLRLWQWIIASVRKEHPGVIFLAEAFTRPHIMEHLAMTGFTQSYTYFTWRNTKEELQAYMKELTKGPKQYFFRPNFWPNTPDILPEHLVTGGTNMHVIRLLLAATLSSSYGIYGPVYERGINEPFPGKEEYADNEKYEIKNWEQIAETRIEQVIRQVNSIRKEFPALQTTNNIEFLEVSNDQIMAYMKYDKRSGHHLLIVISLDAHNSQSGWLRLPRERPDYALPLQVQDQLNNEQYLWENDWNYVALDPDTKPAHIFSLHPVA